MVLLLASYKGGIFILYSKIVSERNRLDEQIHTLQQHLKFFPEGKLICTQNGKYQKWFQSDGHSQVYIPKKNRQLAEQLAYKKYLQLQLETLYKERRAIEFYLRHHHDGANLADEYLAEHPEYRELLATHFTPLSRELSKWQKAAFDTNTKNPEQRNIKTSSGHMVRSKSEAMIDMALFSHQIPFRYECLLKLGNKKVFPDFTIRHPKTGETYYWEHYGLMDNPSYCQAFSKKMLLYTTNGIIPTINLITTYETERNPLGYDVVEEMIARYFL